MAAQIATHHIKVENVLEMFAFGSTYENEIILNEAKDTIKRYFYHDIYVLQMFYISIFLHRNKAQIFGPDKEENYNNFMENYPKLMYELFLQ